MISQEILNSFRGKKCTVTGGTGLIGREIVTILADAGAKVTSVSLDTLELDDRVTYIRMDLCSFGNCKLLTEDEDYVFHVAGVKGSIDVTKSKPASFFVPLLQFNANVLEACRINEVEKVVYTSSIGAYTSAEVFVEGVGDEGPPMDMYPGWAKRMAEMQIRLYREQYGLKNFAIVRPCNIYGPGDNFDPDNAMVIPTLMYKIARGDDPVEVWGDGSAIRDFAFSREVAEGVILALYHQPDIPYLNLGSGVGYSIKQLVETLQQVTPFNYHFDTTKSNGFPRRVMDITKARELIGYNPSMYLHDGLKETWEWFLENREEYKQKKNYFKE